MEVLKPTKIKVKFVQMIEEDRININILHTLIKESWNSADVENRWIFYDDMSFHERASRENRLNISSKVMTENNPNCLAHSSLAISIRVRSWKANFYKKMKVYSISTWMIVINNSERREQSAAEWLDKRVSNKLA